MELLIPLARKQIRKKTEKKKREKSELCVLEGMVNLK